MVSATFRLLYAWERDLIPILQDAAWPSGRSGWVRKFPTAQSSNPGPLTCNGSLNLLVTYDKVSKQHCLLFQKQVTKYSYIDNLNWIHRSPLQCSSTLQRSGLLVCYIYESRFRSLLIFSQHLKVAGRECVVISFH